MASEILTNLSASFTDEIPAVRIWISTRPTPAEQSDGSDPWTIEIGTGEYWYATRTEGDWAVFAVASQPGRADIRVARGLDLREAVRVLVAREVAARLSGHLEPHLCAAR